MGATTSRDSFFLAQLVTRLLVRQARKRSNLRTPVPGNPTAEVVSALSRHQCFLLLFYFFPFCFKDKHLAVICRSLYFYHSLDFCNDDRADPSL